MPPLLLLLLLFEQIVFNELTENDKTVAAREAVLSKETEAALEFASNTPLKSSGSKEKAADVFDPVALVSSVNSYLKAFQRIHDDAVDNGVSYANMALALTDPDDGEKCPLSQV